jgi:protein phosphatase
MRTEYQGITLEWAAATDVGRVRSLNEDSFLAAPPVFVVADGMGGHEAGEVASALVTRRLGDRLQGPPPEVDTVAKEFQTIHGLLRGVNIDGRNVDMGTTAVALIVSINNGIMGWLVVNIGDSRVYCVSKGIFTRVTSDHSYVQELVDAGELQADDARHHPQRNIVTQALGVMDVARPDFWVRPITTGERFLLCSDGLTGELEDGEIEAVLAGSISPDDAVGRLKEQALNRGGRDNVTICVVDVMAVPVSLEESTETKPGHRSERSRAEPPGPASQFNRIAIDDVPLWGVEDAAMAGSPPVASPLTLIADVPADGTSAAVTDDPGALARILPPLITGAPPSGGPEGGS